MWEILTENGIHSRWIPLETTTFLAPKTKSFSNLHAALVFASSNIYKQKTKATEEEDKKCQKATFFTLDNNYKRRSSKTKSAEENHFDATI